MVASLELANVEYEIHVVEDGISDELRAILEPKVQTIQATEERGVPASLAKSYEVALKFADDDWVYFCEDDYLHRAECMLYIDEMLRGAVTYLQPYDRGQLYIHPCDYPDRYMRPDRYTGALDDRYLVFCSGHCHWREVPSATYTWLMRVGVLREHLVLFHENIAHHARFGTGDQFLGETIFKREDALCLSPLPSLSTHLHEAVMSPIIDWPGVAAPFDAAI
ncbi:MAG: glycosyltransferase involved in cell wall biosynthesis [Candidatus Latescibacterota bacterium]